MKMILDPDVSVTSTGTSNEYGIVFSDNYVRTETDVERFTRYSIESTVMAERLAEAGAWDEFVVAAGFADHWHKIALAMAALGLASESLAKVTFDLPAKVRRLGSPPETP